MSEASGFSQNLYEFKDKIKPFRQAIDVQNLRRRVDIVLWQRRECKVRHICIWALRDYLPSRINPADASEDQLERLGKAWNPATFGVKQKNVFDESYRKAGKLEIINFSTGLNIWKLGLIEIVRSAVLEEGESSKPVEAELYKLNVYGEQRS